MVTKSPDSVSIWEGLSTVSSKDISLRGLMSGPLKDPVIETLWPLVVGLRFRGKKQGSSI